MKITNQTHVRELRGPVILTEPKSDWMSISGVLHLGYNNGSRVLTLLAQTGAEDGV